MEVLMQRSPRNVVKNNIFECIINNVFRKKQISIWIYVTWYLLPMLIFVAIVFSNFSKTFPVFC